MPPLKEEHQKKLAPLVKKTCIGAILTIALYIFSYQYIDIPILHLSQQISSHILTTTAKTFSTIFSPESWGALAVICTMIFLYTRKKHTNSLKKEAQKKHLFIISLSLYIAFIANIILKIIIGRYRPEYMISESLYGFHPFRITSSSSPSAHASLAFSGALAITYKLKIKYSIIIGVIIAIIVSISRIILVKHYLADLVLGAYIGIFSFYWAKYLANLKYVTKRFL